MRIPKVNVHTVKSPARFVARISRRFLYTLANKAEFYVSKSRVAFFALIMRANIFHCRNCKNYIYDCRSKYIDPAPIQVSLTEIMRVGLSSYSGSGPYFHK